MKATLNICLLAVLLTVHTALATKDTQQQDPGASSIYSMGYSAPLASVVAVVGDKKNATGNSFSEPVGSTDKTFKVNLKVENLKMLPGDYNVSISSKKISRFQSTSSDLVYYVAVEADSTFEF